MTSRQSKTNNIGRPLSGDPSGNTFAGQWENSAGALVLAVFVASPTLALVTIEQSVNRGASIQLTDTFNIGATQIDKMNVFRVPSGFAWFRVRIENFEGNQTYLSLNTYLESSYIEPTTTVSIGGVVDVSGSVAVTNLITETLATRRVDFLVVGDWYRVASVGITTGAQWNQIGAIVNGEPIPTIGRLFKCLQVGPAAQNGGECYDVEYTDSVSADVTNLITETLATRRVDFLVVGDWYRVASVGITTGAQWNQIGAIVNGEPIPTIGRLFKCLQVGPAAQNGGECYDVEYTDAVSASISNFPATQAVSGTVSLTNPTTVRVADFYGDPLIASAGNLMVGINNIYTANPLHVIVDSVTPATTAVAGGLAVSTTGVTLKASAGKLLTLHIDSDGASGINFVKIYNVAVPTSADTPIFTIGVLFGSSQNIDCSSLSFATAIGVRATNAAAAGDNTPPTNTINVTAFFT